jgi:hypothetical protein
MSDKNKIGKDYLNWEPYLHVLLGQWMIPPEVSDQTLLSLLAEVKADAASAVRQSMRGQYDERAMLKGWLTSIVPSLRGVLIKNSQPKLVK